MDYILQYPLTEDDVDFINRSSIEIEIHNPEVVGNDSGWCDMDTGCRIVTKCDRAIFRNVGEPDLLMLKLKFNDRLKLLHDGLKSIYAVD
jgi:hypothetical protein